MNFLSSPQQKSKITRIEYDQYDTMMTMERFVFTEIEGDP